MVTGTKIHTKTKINSAKAAGHEEKNLVQQNAPSRNSLAHNQSKTKVNENSGSKLYEYKITTVPVLQSQRKTAYLGFIIALRSALKIAQRLFKKHFKYFLTYKLSQDHLETFFSVIRRMGGFNNKPNLSSIFFGFQENNYFHS